MISENFHTPSEFFGIVWFPKINVTIKEIFHDELREATSSACLLLFAEGG